jgi:hypothetical protein
MVAGRRECTDHSRNDAHRRCGRRSIWGNSATEPTRSADLGCRNISSHYKDYSGWWPNTARQIQRDEWAIAGAIDKGETTLCEIIQVQCSDGTKKTVLNSAVPLRNQSQITGAVDIIQDISGQHVQAQLATSRWLFPK